MGDVVEFDRRLGPFAGRQGLRVAVAEAVREVQVPDPYPGGGTVRPDLVLGVPLKNPLWRRDCPNGIQPNNTTPCEPYLNPAAFMRPAKGSLGTAPRTLDVRSPMQEYFDFSFQKNFPFPFKDNEGKRRINFRNPLKFNGRNASANWPPSSP